jgi:hypothetical protein
MPITPFSGVRISWLISLRKGSAPPEAGVVSPAFVAVVARFLGIRFPRSETA